MLVNPTHLVCLMQPFQMRYLVVHFWSKICLFVCVRQQQKEFYSPTTGKCPGGAPKRYPVLAHKERINTK